MSPSIASNVVQEVRKYIVFVPTKKFEAVANAFREAFRLNLLRETANQYPLQSHLSQPAVNHSQSTDVQRASTLQKQYLAAFNASLDRRVFVIEREYRVRITLNELKPVIVHGQVGHQIRIQGKSQQATKRAWQRLCELIPEIKRYAHPKRVVNSLSHGSLAKNPQESSSRNKRPMFCWESLGKDACLEKSDEFDEVPLQTCSHAASAHQGSLNLPSSRASQFTPTRIKFKERGKASPSPHTRQCLHRSTQTEDVTIIDGPVSANKGNTSVTQFWNRIGQLVGHSVVNAILASQNISTPLEDQVSSSKDVPDVTHSYLLEKNSPNLHSDDLFINKPLPPLLGKDPVSEKLSDSDPSAKCINQEEKTHPRSISVDHAPIQPPSEDVEMLNANSSCRSRTRVLTFSKGLRHSQSTPTVSSKASKNHKSQNKSSRSDSSSPPPKNNSSKDDTMSPSHVCLAKKEQISFKDVLVKNVGRLKYRLLVGDKRAIVVMPFNPKTRPLFRHDISGQPKSTKLLHFCRNNDLKISTIKLIEPTSNESVIKKPTLALDCKMSDHSKFEEVLSRLDDLIEQEINSRI